MKSYLMHTESAIELKFIQYWMRKKEEQKKRKHVLAKKELCRIMVVGLKSISELVKLEQTQCGLFPLDYCYVHWYIEFEI